MDTQLTNWAPAVIAVIAIVTLLVKGGMWIGSVNARLDNTQSRLDTIEALIQEIRRDLRTLFRRLPTSTTTEDSPLRLTDLGKTISEDIGAVPWAIELATELRPQVAGRRPDEIHEFCFEYVYHQFHPDKDLDRAIGMAACENGIDRTEVLDVLAVELRDRLLRETIQ